MINIIIMMAMTDRARADATSERERRAPTQDILLGKPPSDEHVLRDALKVALVLPHHPLRQPPEGLHEQVPPSLGHGVPEGDGAQAEVHDSCRPRALDPLLQVLRESVEVKPKVLIGWIFFSLSYNLESMFSLTCFRDFGEE